MTTAAIMAPREPEHLPPEIWWGDFQVEQNDAFRRIVGALSISVERRTHEWRIESEREEYAAHQGAPGHAADAPGGCPVREEAARFVFRRCDNPLHLTPVLADRPVVARPLAPLQVPPTEEATVFISSPLWVRIGVHEPAVTLLEIPIFRPSDTWFGPSTREGEICYASRTAARLGMDDMPLRPDRAITPVRVANRSGEMLVLERLSLPVPLLSLYAVPSGLLWTQAVTMERKSDSELVDLKLGDGPPPEAPGAALTAGPRQSPSKGTIVRALSALLG